MGLKVGGAACDTPSGQEVLFNPCKKAEPRKSSNNLEQFRTHQFMASLLLFLFDSGGLNRLWFAFSFAPSRGASA